MGMGSRYLYRATRAQATFTARSTEAEARTEAAEEGKPLRAKTFRRGGGIVCHDFLLSCRAVLSRAVLERCGAVLQGYHRCAVLICACCAESWHLAECRTFHLYRYVGRRTEGRIGRGW